MATDREAVRKAAAAGIKTLADLGKQFCFVGLGLGRGEEFSVVLSRIVLL